MSTSPDRVIRAGGMSLVADGSIFHDEKPIDTLLVAGTPPADFVEMARVDSARRLLEDTDRPLQRVASSSGFVNPDTMRRAFLRRIGISPSDYRERFRG
jgi:hypothetical protein